MTTKDKVARRKLSLLQLAYELSNVSKACHIMGYSRQQFYEIRRNYQTYGSQGLLDRLPGAKGPHPNRVSEDVEKAILQSMTGLIRYLTRQIDRIEAQIAALANSPRLASRVGLLASAPGVGSVVSATLMAELPELGTIDRRSIASLAGLAPIARDSGTMRAKRRIGKGRPIVRAALTIAALHACEWDAGFKAFRQRLEAKGKTPKQAICAAARKLLTILNAIVKTGQKYEPRETVSIQLP